MPEPEQDWVGRAIPAAPHWRVRPAWRGVFDKRYYPDPSKCFAANRTCEQVLIREPIPYHCRPVQPHSHTQSADTADVRHRGACDIYPCSNGDDDLVPGAIDGHHDDADSRQSAEELPGDHTHTGGGEHLLLAREDADADTDPDVQALRHPVGGGVL